MLLCENSFHSDAIDMTSLVELTLYFVVFDSQKYIILVLGTLNNYVKFNDLILIYEATKKPFNIDDVPNISGTALIRKDGKFIVTPVKSFRQAAKKAIEDYCHTSEYAEYARRFTPKSFECNTSSTKESTKYTVNAVWVGIDDPTWATKFALAKISKERVSGGKHANTTLTVGKYTMFKDLPAYIYDFNDAVKQKLFHISTLNNIKKLLDLGYIADKVYRVDRSEGRNALSTYVTLTNNGEPYIFARVETYNKQSGQTYLYSKNTRGLFHAAILKKEDCGTTVKETTSDGIRFKKKTTGELHNVNGPARVVGGVESYFLNGKEYHKEKYDNFFKNVANDQREDLANMVGGFE